jgi:hypothetical protein
MGERGAVSANLHVVFQRAGYTGKEGSDARFFVVEKVPVRAPAVALAPSPPAPSPTVPVAAALVAQAELVALIMNAAPFPRPAALPQRA